MINSDFNQHVRPCVRDRSEEPGSPQSAAARAEDSQRIARPRQDIFTSETFYGAGTPK